MSKVDAMQAMREARYAARTANKPVTVGKQAVDKPVVAAKPVAVAPRQKAVVDETPVAIREQSSPAATDSAPDAPEDLCGHRSMNNRLCRRPAGHPEKNHRYN